MFHYFSGEQVRVGDVVRTGNGKLGRVKQIIEPGADAAADYQSAEGGVLILEDWNGAGSYLLETPPDGAAWEDLELVRRGELHEQGASER